jgi:hypothetical protein
MQRGWIVEYCLRDNICCLKAYVVTCVTVKGGCAILLLNGAPAVSRPLLATRIAPEMGPDRRP